MDRFGLSIRLFAANNLTVLVSDCCSVVMVYGQGYCYQKSVLTYYSIDPDSGCSLAWSFSAADWDVHRPPGRWSLVFLEIDV